jgi:hypothetical protein
VGREEIWSETAWWSKAWQEAPKGCELHRLSGFSGQQ